MTKKTTKGAGRKNESVERVLKGLGVSPGIGVGTVHVREKGSIVVPELRIAQSRIGGEKDRFKDAVARARRQIGRLRAKARTMPGEAADEMELLLDAYMQMLKDSRLVRGVERRIAEDRINAEAAVQAELTEISAAFHHMQDDYFAARIADINEVAARLIRNLTTAPRQTPVKMPRGTMIIAEELTPADTAQMDPARIAGIAAVLGGAEGHTAIMARALGIPAVLGVAGLLKNAAPGDTIIIDGGTGRVVVNPKPATTAAFRRRREELHRQQRRLTRLRKQPAVTTDGVEVELSANVELPIEMNLVRQVGAAGIGLLRSEFMFMNRNDIPGEEEQYQNLRALIEPMAGKQVTVRTLDVGGEKIATALMDGFGDSTSSALGLRGIRLSLARTDVLETQFRAILRAGMHGNIRILMPMVSTVSEIRRARDLLVKTARRLKRRGVAVPDPLPPMGVMIEVPGAALSADALAQACDFFAVGSNDLTMYTLAIDRSDEHVAYLYDPLHPAVLRLIQFAAAAGLRARIPISICGEIAGDPRFTALLLGLGFRELSMSPGNIPRVKQRIRSLDMVAASRRAGVIMDQMDAGRIAVLLDDFNALA